MKYYQWFRKLSLQKRVSLILFALLLGYAILNTGVDLYYRRSLKKEKNFVIALIYDVSMSKSGPDFSIKYNVDKKSYTASFKEWHTYKKKKGDYIFIQILKRKPTIYERIDYKVPNCMIWQQLLDSMFNTLPGNPDDLCK
jgi:hypothetical protein